MCLFSHDLAVAIHNEERRQYHDAQLQQQQRRQPQQPQCYPQEGQSSRKSKKKHRNRSYDDDGDFGCILS